MYGSIGIKAKALILIFCSKGENHDGDYDNDADDGSEDNDDDEDVDDEDDDGALEESNYPHTPSRSDHFTEARASFQNLDRTMQ